MNARSISVENETQGIIIENQPEPSVIPMIQYFISSLRVAGRVVQDGTHAEFQQVELDIHA